MESSENMPLVRQSIAELDGIQRALSEEMPYFI